MPSVITQDIIKTAALDRADMTDSNFPLAARVYEYINAAMGELYDLLVTAYEDYFYSTSDVTLVSGTESYDLPTDFYKAVKVYYKESNGARWDMARFTMSELADRTYGVPSVAESRHLRYRIMGDKIIFHPEPLASGTVELWYIPELTKLATDGSDASTAITFCAPVQWEEYLIVSTAIRLLDREESDSSMLRAERDRMTARIISSAADRDAGEPMRINDHYGRLSHGLRRL